MIYLLHYKNNCIYYSVTPPSITITKNESRTETIVRRSNQLLRKGNNRRRKKGINKRKEKY
jgi:hypothetical protein